MSAALIAADRNAVMNAITTITLQPFLTTIV
jgi:hypothetical protein